MMDSEQLSGTTNDAVKDESPAGRRFDLRIDDPETMAALVSYPEERERNRFVRTDLHILSAFSLDNLCRGAGPAGKYLTGNTTIS